ncbi:MAG: decarboxylating 6-phosphogluconate dehydrogenase [Anaerolineales bacterium]|nr:MAG: decarboxylating 6-phosphogluconate dehydrogenase [Anaerolineales bacterium]
MELAIIGLGKMGGNMARRLIKGGHTVIGFNRSSETTKQIASEIGLIPAISIEETVSLLKAPRVVWTMVPSGEATEDTIRVLSGLLSVGDIIIDGGNSNYNDSVRRAKTLETLGINFLDAGTSGGIWGLQEGYSMMVGGKEEIVDYLKPVFDTLAPKKEKGWGYVGPSGAGHFVKMVHNGIEYGLMEAYAEGFELIKAKKEFNIDLYNVAEIWRYGSVVRSWLLDLISTSLKDDQELSDIRGWVADSGEGRWTVVEAISSDVPVPIIALSLFQRFISRQDESYAAKLLSAMRHQFGGHDLKKVEE